MNAEGLIGAILIGIVLLCVIGALGSLLIAFYMDGDSDKQQKQTQIEEYQNAIRTNEKDTEDGST